MYPNIEYNKTTLLHKEKRIKVFQKIETINYTFKSIYF